MLGVLGRRRQAAKTWPKRRRPHRRCAAMVNRRTGGRSSCWAARANGMPPAFSAHALIAAALFPRFRSLPRLRARW